MNTQCAITEMYVIRELFNGQPVVKTLQRAEAAGRENMRGIYY